MDVLPKALGELKNEVEVDLPRAIQQAEWFRLEPFVARCEQMRLQNLTAQGVQIKRPFFEATVNNQKWFSMTYKCLVQRLVKMWSRFGFAVIEFEDHPIYLKVPRVLEMSMIRVRFRTLRNGRREYRVFAQPAPFEVAQERELFDVMIIESSTPPSNDGVCYSEIQVLIPILQYAMEVMLIHRDAAYNGANPLVFLENMPDKGDQSNMTDASLPGVGVPLAMRIGQDDDSLRMVTGDSSSGRRLIENRRTKAMQLLLASQGLGNLLGSSIIDLPNTNAKAWRIGENLHASSGPSVANYSEFEKVRVWAEEKICSQFGVPRQMIAASGFTHNVDTDQMMLMFNNNVLQLREEVINALQDIYLHIYTEHHTTDRKHMLDVSQQSNPITTMSLKQAALVEIYMPSATPLNIYTDLYREGTMTFQAYRERAAKLLGVPISSMNSKPSLSLKDLNGIKPPPTSSSSSSSSTKKPKSKSKSKTSTTSSSKNKRKRTTKS